MCMVNDICVGYDMTILKSIYLRSHLSATSVVKKILGGKLDGRRSIKSHIQKLPR